MTETQDPHDIVPEGVDAETLRRRQRFENSTTDAVERVQCPKPECGSVSIIRRNGSMHEPTAPKTEYRCNRCGHRFDSGVRR